jgi:Uncharacterized protein conserved in bacteria
MTAAADPLNVTVRIMGREYTVACPAEEHEALVVSADFLNERMNAARRRGKALGAERVAVMVALNLARELLASRGDRRVSAAADEVAERIQQLGLDIDRELDAAD